MRSVNAPVPALIQPAENTVQAERELNKLWVAYQDAERVEETASQKLRQRLLAVGQWLVVERAKDPSKRSRSFADLLRNCGVDTQRAAEAMKYAGYVDETVPPGGTNELPSLYEAGVKEKPRKGSSPTTEEGEAEENDGFDPQHEALLVREKLLKAAAKWPVEHRIVLAIELRNASKDIEVMK